jgi:hypothetical protein
MTAKQPWLKNASFDLGFILGPSLLSVIAVFLFADRLDQTHHIPLWAWLVFVLGVDVSHVYSTLFRTYFNSTEFQENKILLTLIPAGMWLLGVLLYSVSGLLFWRTLAYIAVFHFIRQQYGFLRLYTKSEIPNPWDRRLDAAMIYMATLYPIVFWHAHGSRNFHWFIDGDFLTGIPEVVSDIVGGFYLVIVVIYLGREIQKSLQRKFLNLPKNLIVVGTALSWYAGIVHFNGDMIFTMTNVLSHGIPYMALVWLYGERQKERADAPLVLGKFSYRLFFSRFSVPIFFAVLLLFGYLEEGLWAGLVWREHLEAYGVLSKLPHITARDTLAWLVPLLTLPQVTHYVLDGFIWKIKDSNANWQKVLFQTGDQS